MVAINDYPSLTSLPDASLNSGNTVRSNKFEIEDGMYKNGPHEDAPLWLCGRYKTGFGCHQCPALRRCGSVGAQAIDSLNDTHSQPRIQPKTAVVQTE